MEHNVPRLHMHSENICSISDTLYNIAAAAMDVVGKNVPPRHLLLIVFKVFLEVNGYILLNLVTFKPLPPGHGN